MAKRRGGALARETRRFLEQCREAHLWLRSESLAFVTLLSIVPTLGLCFLLLNRSGVTQRWVLDLRQFVMSHLNVVSSEPVQVFFDQVLAALANEKWGWVGLVFLAYTAFSLVTKFGAAQDAILRVKAADRTPFTVSFLRLTLRRALTMLGIPLVVIVSTIATSWIRNESWLRMLFEMDKVGAVLALPLAWAIDVAAITLLYAFVPRRPISKRSAFKAACAVVPCLELTRFGIGLYNRYAVATHKIYGVLAAVPVTILWIQLAWAILLAGTLFLRMRDEGRPL